MNVLEYSQNKTCNCAELPNYTHFENEADVHAINHISGKNNYTIDLSVNDTPIEFNIDTGSGLTIISNVTYKKLFQRQPLLNVSTIIQTYSGEKLNVLGKLVVSVKHNGGVFENLDLYVISGHGISLLGRDWLSSIKLDWCSVNSVITNREVQDIITRHTKLFSEKPGKMRDFKANIRIKPNAVPKFFKPRNVPFALEPAVQKELDRLESEGILRPINHSEWASPIVIVPKPDGRIRICADYKQTVNPVVEVDQYPMPTAEELFAKIQGGQKFSKLDLTTAYLQVEISDESRKCLVINTHKGLKEFTRMPYGIAPASAIFQRKLENELRNIPMTVVKIDDILVSGKNDDDHLRNLEKVFELLESLGLTLNQNKCKFFEDEVVYLGFIIDKHGIKTNPEKVQALANAPIPKNLTELQSFLGGLNYYGKFIPQMSEIANPLYKLLKKDVTWLWGVEQMRSFKMLINKLITSIVSL